MQDVSPPASGGCGLSPDVLRALKSPCAWVDLDALERNCRRMAERISALGARSRPYVKTHKVPAIARPQTRGHCGGIMVSTFAEAHYFAAAGFTDITYGVPIGPHRLREAAGLGRRLERFSVLIDHPATMEMLEQEARAERWRYSVFLEVDCGDHLSGVDPADAASMALAKRLATSPHIDFRGLLSHSGDSYDARGAPAISAVERAEQRSICQFAAVLRDAGVAVPEVSIGSTPTLSVTDDLAGINEVRPGNYAFYDGFQAATGSCERAEVAFSILATVVGAYPAQGKLVIDAGALALSKDIGAEDLQPQLGYGTVYDAATGEHLPDLQLYSVSQEHGQIRGAARFATGGTPIGRKLRIIPNHACLAAALHENYHAIQNGRIVDIWQPARGWWCPTPRRWPSPPPRRFPYPSPARLVPACRQRSPKAMSQISSADGAADNRRRGAWFDLAAGDALGAPYKFLSPEQIAKRAPAPSIMLAGGLREAGEWTDDTALSLAAACAYHCGAFNLSPAAAAMTSG